MHVEVAITPCLLRIGLFCSIIWNKIPENRSWFDMKLRVYNSVDESSPIIQACRDANLEQVQKLFTAGKASSFDRLRGKQSLLDIILEEMALIPMRQDPGFALKKLEKLYLLFKMMISHGLDPGQLWSHQDNKFCGSPLPFLALIPFYIPREFLQSFWTLLAPSLNTASKIPSSPPTSPRCFAFNRVPQPIHLSQSHDSSCTKNTGSRSGKSKKS